MKKGQIKAESIAVPLFFSFMIFIYAPFEIFCLNKGEFWFRLQDFWYIPIVTGVMAFGGSYAIAVMLNGRLRSCYLVLLFSLGICCYLQGNFFNLKIGVLNGEEIKWSDYAIPVVRNTLIWIGIFLIIVVLAVKWKDFLKLATVISFLISGILLVTLTVLLFSQILYEKEDAEVAYMSNEALYEVGDDGIVVILLDMFDNKYFSDLLNRKPELYNSLDGFTYFENCSGAYSTTNYSLNCLFTGHYYHNEGAKWQDEVISEGWYIDELLDDGYSVYTYCPVGLIPDKLAQKVSKNYVEGTLFISNKLHFSYDLYQLVICKYFPDCLKPFFWLSGNEFDVWKAVKQPSDQEVFFDSFSSSNNQFKVGLEKGGVTLNNNEKQYKFIHLDGTHYPYTTDEVGNSVDENWDSLEACEEGCFYIMCEYIDSLKEAGIYDKMSIVILADHGYYTDGALTSPVLLVKPKNSRGKLEKNNAPVSQIDFSATVLDLAGLDYSNQEGVSVLSDIDVNRKRYFYQYNLSEEGSMRYRLIEYIVGNEGNSRENFQLTDREFTPQGTLISHSKYCRTCSEGITYPTEFGLSNEPLLRHWYTDDYPKE